MRFFIALEIPEENKIQLEQIQARLKKVIPSLKLTDLEKLHLTIAFMGEQPNHLKEPLTNLLKEACKDIKPFSIAPAFIDGFPNLHHPRILWIGVKGDTDSLFVLRERIKDGLIQLNLETDARRFIPHIAIGKLINFSLREDQEKELEQIALAEYSSIEVSEIKLFESIAGEGFHQHNTLSEIPLV